MSTSSLKRALDENVHREEPENKVEKNLAVERDQHGRYKLKWEGHDMHSSGQANGQKELQDKRTFSQKVR